MNKKSIEGVMTNPWSRSYSQGCSLIQTDLNMRGLHNKKEDEVKDLVEEALETMNPEVEKDP